MHGTPRNRASKTQSPVRFRDAAGGREARTLRTGFQASLSRSAGRVPCVELRWLLRLLRRSWRGTLPQRKPAARKRTGKQVASGRRRSVIASPPRKMCRVGFRIITGLDRSRTRPSTGNCPFAAIAELCPRSRWPLIAAPNPTQDRTMAKLTVHTADNAPEVAKPPTIANAVYHATGKRIRDLSIT